MSNESKRLAINCVQSALCNAGDNLYRAKAQLTHDPNWKTGNGETIQQLVDTYQTHYNALEHCLTELEAL